ncbi:MAG: 7-cyano-7-deazaguanine synthase QueC [Deltaproteobacteria bacterium]|nr:7-cyano-7-deazaguanine synthase QueC [Deltaproteobacteria bacterium]
MDAFSGQPAVVLVSGGLDSAVVLAMARSQEFAPHALTVRYGQRHGVEVQASAAVARANGVARHLIIDLDLRVFGGSALTADGPVPKGERAPGAAIIPPTYVPARNTIFLSLALAWAETLGARDVFIGVSAVDYSGYPDCRPEYIAAFEAAANLGTRAVEGGRPFRIHAPLVRLSKAETVKAGLALGVDFGLTRTCYDPDPAGRPCGACESCRLRAKGFAEAGVEDPLLKP